MKRLGHLVATLLMIFSPAAAMEAQALATATGPGSYVAVGGGVSAFQTDYGQYRLAGGFGYLDVQPHWRVGLEGEARFLHPDPSEAVTESSYLGGVRVVLWPRPSRFAPYGKFLAGAGKITLPFGYAHGTFRAYAPGAGVDIALTDRISVRALDFEYQHWPAFPYGPLHPYGVGAGISVRLNGVSRFPRGTRARQ